jgi:hypothetical protein
VLSAILQPSRWHPSTMAHDTNNLHRHGNLGAEIAAQIGNRYLLAEGVFMRKDRASQDVIDHHHVGATVHANWSGASIGNPSW